MTLISTGQHYDDNMMGHFFEELNVPAVSADLRVGSADGARQVATVVDRIAEILLRDTPDAVCVFGDTNSALGSALAAAKLGIPVLHVEAGCRSYDMTMQEEINRRVIDHVSGLLLAVSELGVGNLRGERVPGRIEMVGDPLFDVFARYRLPPRERENGRYGLATLHRAENVDDPARLELILSEMEAAARVLQSRWIFPVHPRTRRSLRRRSYPAIRFLDPFSYHEFLEHLRGCLVCVTDSGGVQKEALWAHVPCVTVRSATEWMETIWQGANVLAPPGSDIRSAIVQSPRRAKEADFSNPYGDGRASEMVLAAIKSHCPSTQQSIERDA
jgi:UDP-GlcNAc3NAcA epimerase